MKKVPPLNLPPEYRVSREGGFFEIWRGYEYICLLVWCHQRKKWAATHNMVPNKGSDNYRYDTALEAVQGYGHLRNSQKGRRP